MKVVFLGTGGTYPSKHRNVTSVALQMPGEVLMFDCGEGTQRQLMHSSVSFMRISKVFVTHLHADHFLGIPGLIQSMSLNGRESELAIYGPNGTEETVKAMLNLGYFKCGYPVEARDIAPDSTLDFGTYTVRTASADHTVPALAYAVEESARPGRFDPSKAKALGVLEGPMFRRLQEGRAVTVKGSQVRPEEVMGPPRRGRKFVYTGDTRPSEGLVEFSRGADVLVHDCTVDSKHAKLASEFGHSTAAGAASVAKAACVKRLFLVHFSPRYDDVGILREEARVTFPDSETAEEFSDHVVRHSE